jgi:hypothetical protein
MLDFATQRLMKSLLKGGMQDREEPVSAGDSSGSWHE